MPATAAATRYLTVRENSSRSSLPLLASLSSEAFARAIDPTNPHRHVPPGHPVQDKDSFPSGSANKSTAAALTNAYVLARAQLIDPVPAFAIATLVMIASPMCRLHLDRHWSA